MKKSRRTEKGECPICLKALSKQSIRTHLFYVHDKTREEGAELTRPLAVQLKCPFCARQFHTVGSASMHKKACEKRHGQDEKRVLKAKKLACVFEKCPKNFRTQWLMSIHCLKEHNNLLLGDKLLINKTLLSEEEVKALFDNVYETTTTKYRKCTVGVKTTYWKCQHSGKPVKRSLNGTKNVAKKTRIRRGYRRVVQHCTALAMVTKTENGYRVRMTTFHYGHEVNVSRLPLCDADKAVVLDLMKSGFSIGSIIRKMREDNDDNSRLKWLNDKELRYLKDTYLRPEEINTTVTCKEEPQEDSEEYYVEASTSDAATQTAEDPADKRKSQDKLDRITRLLGEIQAEAIAMARDGNRESELTMLQDQLAELLAHIKMRSGPRPPCTLQTPLPTYLSVTKISSIRPMVTLQTPIVATLDLENIKNDPGPPVPINLQPVASFLENTAERMRTEGESTRKERVKESPP